MQPDESAHWRRLQAACATATQDQHLRAAQADAEQLRRNLADMQAERDTALNNLKQAQAHTRQLQEEHIAKLAAKDAAVSSMEAERETANNSLKQAQAHTRQLQEEHIAELAAKDAAMSSLEAERDTALNSLEQAQAQLRQLQQDQDTMLTARDTAVKSLEDMQAERVTALNSLKAAETHLGSFKAKLHKFGAAWSPHGPLPQQPPAEETAGHEAGAAQAALPQQQAYPAVPGPQKLQGQPAAGPAAAAGSEEPAQQASSPERAAGGTQAGPYASSVAVAGSKKPLQQAASGAAEGAAQSPQQPTVVAAPWPPGSRQQMAACTQPPPATAQPAQTQLTGSLGIKGKQVPQATCAAAKDSGQVQQSAATSDLPVGCLQECPARTQAPCAAAEEQAHSLQQSAAGATSPVGGVQAGHNQQQPPAAGVQSAGAQLKPPSLTAAEGETGEGQQQAQQQRPAVVTLPAAQQVGRQVFARIPPSYQDVAASWILWTKVDGLQADLGTPAKQQAAAESRQRFQQAHRKYWDMG